MGKNHIKMSIEQFKNYMDSKGYDGYKFIGDSELIITDDRCENIVVPDDIEKIKIMFNSEPSKETVITLPYSIRHVEYISYRGQGNRRLKLKELIINCDADEEVVNLEGLKNLEIEKKLYLRISNIDNGFSNCKLDCEIDAQILIIRNSFNSIEESNISLKCRSVVIRGCFSDIKNTQIKVDGGIMLDNSIINGDNIDVYLDCANTINSSLNSLTDYTIKMGTENTEQGQTYKLINGLTNISDSFHGLNIKRLIIPSTTRTIEHPIGDKDTTLEIHIHNKLYSTLYKRYNKDYNKIEWVNDGAGEIEIDSIECEQVRRLSELQLPKELNIFKNRDILGKSILIYDSDDTINSEGVVDINCLLDSSIHIAILRNGSTLGLLCKYPECLANYTPIQLIIDKGVKIIINGALENTFKKLICNMFIVSGHELLENNNISNGDIIGGTSITIVDSLDEALEINKVYKEISSANVSKIKIISGNKLNKVLMDNRYISDIKDLYVLEKILGYGKKQQKNKEYIYKICDNLYKVLTKHYGKSDKLEESKLKELNYLVSINIGYNTCLILYNKSIVLYKGGKEIYRKHNKDCTFIKKHMNTQNKSIGSILREGDYISISGKYNKAIISGAVVPELWINKAMDNFISNVILIEILKGTCNEIIEAILYDIVADRYFRCSLIGSRLKESIYPNGYKYSVLMIRKVLEEA